MSTHDSLPISLTNTVNDYALYSVLASRGEEWTSSWGGMSQGPGILPSGYLKPDLPVRQFLKLLRIQQADFLALDFDEALLAELAEHA
jgi:hypothetical protein